MNILRLFLVLATFSPYCISAQNFSAMEWGTDSTFEVATWNIERFPKNNQTTKDAVGQIMKALEIDVWALQEIDDSSDLKSAIVNNPDLKAVFGKDRFRGLAYVYNSKTIKNVSSYQLFSQSQYWNPLPRSPLVLEFTYNDSTIRVINNHYKCCGDGKWDKTKTNDEEGRRYAGHRLIMDYIDSLWSNENVIVVGDLNDILTDSRDNNIFQNELTNSQQYRFVDLAIEESSNANWSYPSWPSHLDHILINGPLTKYFGNSSSGVSCVKVDNYMPGKWSDYDSDISDHRPVTYKFDFKAEVETKDSIETNIKSSGKINLGITIFPNPSSGRVTIDVDNRFNANNLKIIDMSGAVLFQFDINPEFQESHNVVEIDKAGRYIIQVLKNETVIRSECFIISR